MEPDKWRDLAFPERREKKILAVTSTGEHSVRATIGKYQKNYLPSWVATQCGLVSRNVLDFSLSGADL